MFENVALDGINIKGMEGHEPMNYPQMYNYSFVGFVKRHVPDVVYVKDIIWQNACTSTVDDRDVLQLPPGGISPDNALEVVMKDGYGQQHSFFYII
jgi:hypothetical protein